MIFLKWKPYDTSDGWGAAARPLSRITMFRYGFVLRIAKLYLNAWCSGLSECLINRNFRNEGLSPHNPEFTMLEFYQAYAIIVI